VSETVGPRVGDPEVYPVEHLPCGCVVAVETNVVVFAPNACTDHTAGRTIPDDPDFEEWTEHGEPVG
jgi:hypothetical protein